MNHKDPQKGYERSQSIVHGEDDKVRTYRNATVFPHNTPSPSQWLNVNILTVNTNEQRRLLPLFIAFLPVAKH